MVLRMTTQTTRTTDKLPAVVTERLTPAFFANLDFSPALLLSVQLDTSITSHPEYAHACKSGFTCYFDDMLEADEEEDSFVLVSRYYTHSEVVQFVIDNRMPEANGDFKPSIDAWKVGFVVGWLSALALTDRPLALLGLDTLHTLSCRLQALKRGHH